MMTVIRLFIILIKIFMMLFVSAMIIIQIPELQYDFGTKEPLRIASVGELSVERFPTSTFVSIQGKANFTKAASFARYGVGYTYFLLDEYGDKLVVRTHETVNEEWVDLDFHLGRLRPYDQMPFSRSVRGGFLKLFDLSIPEDAFFLARDDVPRCSGWSIAGMIFACVLWCVLVYFFFIHSHIFSRRANKI